MGKYSMVFGWPGISIILMNFSMRQMRFLLGAMRDWTRFPFGRIMWMFALREIYPM